MINSKARRIAGCFMLAGTAGVLSACDGGVASSSSTPANTASSSPVIPPVSSAQTVSSTPVASSSAPSVPVFNPPPEEVAGPPTLTMAINAGGGAATLDGIQYQADAYFTGGLTYTGNVDIAGTNEDDVYLSERYDSSSYAIPVANGNYEVHFNFSETYHQGEGLRVFNVMVENEMMLSNVDIYKTAGFNAALTEKVSNISVNDGTLNIEFQSVTALAKVTGIVIYKTSNVVTHADKGKDIFEARCKGCHEADGKAIGTRKDESGHDFDSLMISAMSMPIMPACDAECAYYTAKYIASVNPFFERPIPGPEPDMPTMDIDPAPVVMARLNKYEYNNTVRDLFGITSNPADDFPLDLTGVFKNDNEALSTSNFHVEVFDSLAAEIATEVVQAAWNGNRTVIPCDISAASCAQTVINDLGLKVWRRPLSNEESAALKSVYDSVQAAGNRQASMTALLRAMLLSPNFLFRPEIDENLSSNQARPLNAYELASRMSYFLWASTPDDALLAKAANGSLTNDATLRAEATRMLADPKSESLLTNFAETWLAFEYLKSHEVDTNLYPQYTDTIEDAFIEETRAFLKHIISEGRPISEIMNAKYTFLNETLANYYGVQGVSGDYMRRYNWPEGAKRRGIMGHGSSLTAHALPNKTSPVRRGTWIMDKFLCDRPPEPDGDVIAQFPTIPDGLNPRQVSELHKESSSICAACHTYVDPIGYGMENFSPVGQWRDFYPNGDAVDPSSELPTGEVFYSLTELADILAPKAQFTLCTIGYAMSYATGRVQNTLAAAGAETSDYPAIYDIYEKTKDSSHSITDIFTEIVLSPAFRQRRGANSQ